MFARMTWTHALAFIALFLAVPAAAQDEFFPLTTQVELDPGNRDVEVGKLQFRGGVEIAPDKAGIGGISALEWHDGWLHAVTDDGRWLVLRPENTLGRLVDVSSITIDNLRDLKGGKLGNKERGDAEAMTRLPSGEWLIAFEQQHRIWRYGALDAAALGPDERAAALLSGAAANSGIETLAAYDDGLLACGEWVDPARPNCLRITGAGATAFHLPAPEGIAEAGGVPTDAACKADGTCYVLFRSYRETEGNRAAVVEVAADNAARTLALFTPELLLDNFEGLALRENDKGDFLYLISDDNFRNCDGNDRPGCQRTLLMKFLIKGTEPPAPAGPVVVAAAPPRLETARPGKRPFPDAASTSVVLTTELGTITIALETERAPVTARNFLRYVDEKRFDGTVFYRAMRLDREPRPNGLLQGGTQYDPKRILPPIPHEPTTQTGLTHTHGALSMAMGEPGSANGDFSIMIEDQTGLNADPAATDPVWKNGYAVFGYVTEGMDVVAAIHGTAIDPDKGEGWMKGEMLAKPVKIISARRAPAAQQALAP
jgi:cyclophilin family peptidyl-prolyl cis-trans isomerase